MQKITMLLILTLGLLSCNDETEKPVDNKPMTTEQQKARLDKLKLDFNKDGKLNSDDPNYLFISDKAGRHFKQISPENMNLNSWETIKETNKILMMATKDTNGDKKFDDKDETIPLVYDLTRNTTSTE